jgi:hypothetical protein
MAMKRAPIDHAARGPASAQLDELALVSRDTNDAQPTLMHVIGPGGRRLTFDDLPLPDTRRWVIRRKAEVVAAVRGGLLSVEEACNRYALNADELLSWQDCIVRACRAPYDSNTVLPKECHEDGEICRSRLDRYWFRPEKAQIEPQHQVHGSQKAQF